MNVAMPRLCQCKTVAETGGRFGDFSPFVPAVLEDGDVLCSARTDAGKWNVFRFHANETEQMLGSVEVCSHPASGGGVLAVYALQTDGSRVVLVGRNREFTLIAHAGPLGPTVNSAGLVAFRTERPGGLHQVCSFDDEPRIHADSTQFEAFHGLPLAMPDGSVVFRADRHDGVQGIFRSDSGKFSPIVVSGEQFKSLGNFPSAVDDSVAFCALSTEGESNAYIVRNGEVQPLLRDTAALATLRGVLVDAKDRVTYYATPASGEYAGRLAVFQTDGTHSDCLLAIGASMDDSLVEEFALNPVSINRNGRVAIRVKLTSGKQKILAFDPVRQN